MSTVHVQCLCTAYVYIVITCLMYSMLSKCTAYIYRQIKIMVGSIHVYAVK